MVAPASTYLVQETTIAAGPVVVPEGLSYGAPVAFAGCAGFFHPAAGETGVVMCPPWGYEDLVLRKSWRLLAESIAAAGFPCLRFDYPGTGDSLGHALDVAEVATWVDATDAAAETLRRLSGARRFVFLGQSLGAAIATMAASRRDDVAGLQLVAPIERGRAFVRELGVTSRLIAERLGIASGGGEGDLDVVGFQLSRAMVESLKAIDVSKLAPSGVIDVTIFDSSERAAGVEVARAMRARGQAVVFEEIDALRVLVSDTTEIQPLPVEAARIVAALRRVDPAATPRRSASPAPEPATLVGDGFVEEPVRFGRDDVLFGVLCRPAGGRTGPAVALLNRGLNPHVGWRRTGVDHARALARAGVTSLRFDVAGLGESRDEPRRDTNLIYSLELLPSVAAAVDVLASLGPTRIVLSGVCSGAYIALQAAAADPRVGDVVVFNPQRFVWNPAERMEDLIRFGLRSSSDYLGDLKRGGILTKLIRSRRRILPALAFLIRSHVRGVMAAVPLALRTLGRRRSMEARILALFRGLERRGTRVSMIFADGDPGLAELSYFFGPEGRRFAFEGASIAIVEGVDHNFTSTAACDLMAERILSAATQVTRRERPDRVRAPSAPRVCMP